MRIIRQVILISFMFICLGFNLIKANALTTKTIYADYSNGSLSNSGKFKYSPSNLGLLFDSATGSLGTKYETASYGLRFWFSEAITTSNTYTIQLNFNDYDVYESVGINYVKVYIYSNDDINEASLLSVTKSNKSTQYKTLTIKFVSNYTGTIVRVDIQKENNDSTYARIFGPLNFRLNSVQTETSQAEGTEQIIINNNQNTQNIINNENQNTQNIIDNQNQNSQNIIDSTLVCDEIDSTDIKIDGYLQSNGVIENGTWAKNNFGITDYLSTDNATITVLAKYDNASTALCFYDKNKSKLSCILNSSMTANTEITIPTDAKYFRASIYKLQNIPRFNYCRNGNQAISDNLNDLNSNLTNDSPIDVSSLGNTVGWLPPGPIDAIINLPLNMLNGLLTAFNKTCSPLSVPVPYLSQNITIPCLSTIFAKVNGLTNFWSWVGLIASVVILYKYLIALYDYYDHLTTLQANYLSDFGGAP